MGNYQITPTKIKAIEQIRGHRIPHQTTKAFRHQQKQERR